jgi:hypothetical protein
MGRHLLVVMSNPVSAERETEYNEWYSGRHIGDVVGIPGFAAATRYVASPAQVVGQPQLKYLAVYEIDAEDPADAVKSLREALATPGLVPVSDALDRKSLFVHVYTAITDKVTRVG